MNRKNQNVIVRSNLSGVIVGKLLDVNLGERWVELENAVRLWKWKALKGVSLQSIANYGIDRSQSVVEPAVGWMAIMDVVDITPISEDAMATLSNQALARDQRRPVSASLSGKKPTNEPKR